MQNVSVSRDNNFKTRVNAGQRRRFIRNLDCGTHLWQCLDSGRSCCTRCVTCFLSILYTNMAPNYHKPCQELVQDLKDIANKLKIHSIESTDCTKSG